MIRSMERSTLLTGEWYKSMSAGNVVAGDYELIETEILTADTASVIFTNLGDFSSTYKHLQLRLSAKGKRATFAQDIFRLVLNGDTTMANYNGHNLIGNGSSVTSGFDSNFNNIGFTDGSGSPADAFGGAVIDFTDAYNTSKNTTVRSLSGHASPAAGGATGSRVGLVSLLYRNTASITSIRIDSLDSTLAAKSRFSLYGIRG